jgi:adenylate kinase family enzyme
MRLSLKRFYRVIAFITKVLTGGIIMIHRMHILGASGSGTTTLGKALSTKFGFKHFDTDNYYWLPSEPPFQEKRDILDRQELLKRDLESNSEWVLTGSLCGWGDIFIPFFDLVVFLWIPMDIRISRIKEREVKRYGQEAVSEVEKCMKHQRHL